MVGTSNPMMTARERWPHLIVGAWVVGEERGVGFIIVMSFGFRGSGFDDSKMETVQLVLQARLSMTSSDKNDLVDFTLFSGRIVLLTWMKRWILVGSCNNWKQK
jgi:hypothetical protein